MCINLKMKVYKFDKYQRLKVLIDVIIKFRLNSRKIIRNKASVIIASDVIMKIFIVYKNDISKDRDFLFESDYFQNFKLIDGVFVHVIDFIIFFI